MRKLFILFTILLSSTFAFAEVCYIEGGYKFIFDSKVDNKLTKTAKAYTVVFQKAKGKSKGVRKGYEGKVFMEARCLSGIKNILIVAYHSKPNYFASMSLHQVQTERYVGQWHDSKGKSGDIMIAKIGQTQSNNKDMNILGGGNVGGGNKNQSNNKDNGLGGNGFGNSLGNKPKNNNSTIPGRFNKPVFKGYRIDLCLKRGQQCGKPAADIFCKLKGFKRSLGFQKENNIGTQAPTLILGEKKLCTGTECDGFEYIDCN